MVVLKTKDLLTGRVDTEQKQRWELKHAASVTCFHMYKTDSKFHRNWMKTAFSQADVGIQTLAEDLDSLNHEQP